MKPKSALAAIAAAVALAGCATNPSVPRVTVDKSLWGDVAVSEPVITPADTQSQFLAANVQVENISGGELPVQWKATWYDSAGTEIATATSAWNGTAVLPSETRGFKAVSATREANDVHYYLRRQP